MSDAAVRAVQGRAPARARRVAPRAFDEAIAAYREAAGIAPDRAHAQASLAGILARTGRISEALAAYDVALARQPDDEASLRGRAEMLAIAGRRTDAAETLDRLADVLDRDGRLAEACDVARRALELAESRAGAAARASSHGCDGRPAIRAAERPVARSAARGGPGPTSLAGRAGPGGAEAEARRPRRAGPRRPRPC